MNQYLIALQDLELGSIAFLFSCLMFLAIVFFYFLLRHKKVGNKNIENISKLISYGVISFIKIWFSKLFIFGAFTTLLIYMNFGFESMLSFILGLLTSIFSIILGLKAAEKGNSRTLSLAKTKNEHSAFFISILSGSVSGLSVAVLSLAGISFLFYMFGSNLDQINSIVAFSLGASSVALFTRLGGGMFSKGADISTYLLMKDDKKLSDKAKNLSIIVDNSGDNISDIAGMGSDIFESNVEAIISSILIAATMGTASITKYFGEETLRRELMILPLIVAMTGIVASILGVVSTLFIKKLKNKTKSTIDYIDYITHSIFVLLLLAIMSATGYHKNLYIPLLVGNICGFLISKTANFYTSGHPVKTLIEKSKQGSAMNIISGFATGLESAIVPLFLITGTMFISYKFGGLYGISLSAVGIIATVAMSMTLNSGGPIADNAHGMSFLINMPEKAKEITGKLDMIGNTTAATTKGMATGASALTAFSLFVAYKQSIEYRMNSTFFLEITNPNVIIGMILGAISVVWCATLLMSSVSNLSFKMFNIIKRGKIFGNPIEGQKKNVVPVQRDEIEDFVSQSTKLSFTEIIAPALVAILMPIAIGYVIGVDALGGALVGSFIVGIIFALFMCNMGGAWDNAKKQIDITMDKKQKAELYDIALTGDIIGDPLKDTVGPAMNIIVKIIAIVALIIIPVILK